MDLAWECRDMPGTGDWYIADCDGGIVFLTQWKQIIKIEAMRIAYNLEEQHHWIDLSFHASSPPCEWVGKFLDGEIELETKYETPNFRSTTPEIGRVRQSSSSYVMPARNFGNTMEAHPKSWRVESYHSPVRAYLAEEHWCDCRIGLSAIS